MISPTCGSWIGARTCARDPPRMAGDRPASGLLGPAARVGAAVEAPAWGALVDLPRPAGDRLAQTVGVAAGVLHLVGVRRPVDAAVGHPAGRQPGAAAASELAGLPSPPGGVTDDLVEVDVLVELFQLSGPGVRDRLLERVGERARVGSTVGASSVALARGRPSPAFTGSCPLRGTARARWRFGFADDSPVLACRVVEPFELAVGDPQEPGVEVVERSEVGLAEDRAPDRLQRGERLRVDDPVVGARV